MFLSEPAIKKEKIHELRTFLIDLAGNLSEHNEDIASDIMDVVADIDEFEIETDRQLALINATLEDLEKLEDIIADLEALYQSLDQAEEDRSRGERIKHRQEGDEKARVLGPRRP